MSKHNDIAQCKTASEIIRYAEHHGGYVDRQTGSHVMVKGPSGGLCSVPRHPGEMPTGTRFNVLKTLRAIGIIVFLMFCLYGFVCVQAARDMFFGG